MLWEGQVHDAVNLHESRSHGALWFPEWRYLLEENSESRKEVGLGWGDEPVPCDPYHPSNPSNPDITKELANWMEIAYAILCFCYMLC